MARVKGLPLALLLLSLSAGCLSAQIRPVSETAAKLQTIVVVPMEAPPLEYVAWEASDLLMLENLTPGGIIRIGGRQAKIVASGISMVITLMDMKDLVDALQERLAIAESMENMLDEEEAWVPTIVLSREVAGRIALEGRSAVILEREIHEIPGITSKGRTVFLENWMAPLRAWYNRDRSSFDYTCYLDRKVDAILEVGLMNYSLVESHLLLQVVLKLIDPATGHVLGRTRDVVMVRTPHPRKLFMDGGRPFKMLFAAAGRDSVVANLTYLGLLPERR